MSVLEIPGFDVIEMIGQGGMASVWKARQLSLDRIVAIKILSPELTGDEADIERFQAEARSAAKLKHSGIVQVYDAQEYEGQYYFVMEFIAGYTVGDWTRRKGELDESDALLVAECVADAMSYAWEKEGIIHCDIKPDNVMIDADGTVKVADLGLARTIRAMTQDEDTDEVMGTPAYISPEQATGAPDLDCRADIYSLGAMLYHMVTGRMLFTGYDDTDVMEMQITDCDEDPFDVNAELTPGFSCLLQRMLAKSPDARQEDWDAVAHDIKRVKHGHLPHGGWLPEGHSTIRKSEGQNGRHVRRTPQAASASVGPSKFIAMAVVVLVLVVVVVAFAVTRKGRRGPVGRGPTVVDPVTSSSGQGSTGQNDAARRARLSRMYTTATNWVAAHPEQYEACIRKLEDVRSEGTGTIYGQHAFREIQRLQEKRSSDVEEIMGGLRAQIAPMVERGDYLRAADTIERYAGRLAHESQPARAAFVEKLRKQHERDERERNHQIEAANTRLAETLARAAEILKGGEPALPAARREVEELLGAPGMDSVESQVTMLLQILEGAEEIDSRILRSFEENAGRQVVVNFTSGPKTVSVGEVTSDAVVGKQIIRAGSSVAEVPVQFTAKDLSTRERLERMGSEGDPSVALVKGLIAMQSSKSYDYAEKFLAMTDPQIGEPLLAQLSELRSGALESAAEHELSTIMSTAGISVGPYNKDLWLQAISRMRMAPDRIPVVRARVTQYRQKYGETRFAGEVEPILMALSNAGTMQTSGGRDAVEPDPVRPPAGGGPFKIPEEVMMVRNNPVAVMGLLTFRNPGLNAEEVHADFDDEGNVRSVSIRSQALRNIEPLAALGGMNRVAISYREKGDMDTIFPLSVLPLRSLTVRNAGVEDLSPVLHMPLSSLSVPDNPIRDISMLANTRITELNIRGTEVRDFSVLPRMNLFELDVSDTDFDDLSILRGTTVKVLRVNETAVRSLLPLEGMKLLHLEIAGTQISDLRWLQGMPLKHLDCRRIPARSASVIYDLPLETLWADEDLVNINFVRRMRTLKEFNGEPINGGAPDGPRHNKPDWRRRR